MLTGIKEELQGLLHRSKESTQEWGVGESAKAGDAEGSSRVFQEIAQLRRLVGDVQTQLEQQHQDVRGWFGTKDQRFAHGIDSDDGVMGKLDFVVSMLMAVRGEGFDTPRQACVLPPWDFAQDHGLSEAERAPEVWVKRLQEWLKDDCKGGKGFFTKKKRLFLICAHTRRLVPCGPNGQGYDIQQPRTWFRMSVSVATFALQVVFSTLAAMAVAPVSGAGAAVETAVSTAMEGVESVLETQLAGLSLNEDGADVDVKPQVKPIISTTVCVWLYAELVRFLKLRGEHLCHILYGNSESRIFTVPPARILPRSYP